MTRRIGLFGGTFDPPHVGHLALAEWARERLVLDRVLFVPAGSPPHKRRGNLSSAGDRVAMTRLAVLGNRAFTVSTVEARREGPSFTVETLRALARAHPRSRLFLLIGADSLGDFHTWRDPQEILEIATLAVAGRPGGAAGREGRGPAGRIARSRRLVRLDNPVLDVSSSAIRARVRAGHSVRYLVPEAVAAYIARRGLYRGRA
jgi:nicotinate-nucleotide adenylyltransferase